MNGSCQALAEALKVNNVLRRLDVTGCEIGNEVVQAWKLERRFPHSRCIQDNTR